MAALDKIFDLLDTEPDMVDRPGALDPGEIRGEIELEGVSFSYAGRGARATSALGAARRRPARAARADAGAGRRDGRGQVDAGEAGGALLRPAAGAGAGRRPRPARPEGAGAAQPARDRAAGGVPVLGHGAREHRLRAPRRERRGDPGGGGGGRRATGSSSGCRTATTPRSASAGSSCRRASASWSRSRGRWSPTRGS